MVAKQCVATAVRFIVNKTMLLEWRTRYATVNGWPSGVRRTIGIQTTPHHWPSLFLDIMPEKPLGEAQQR